MATPLVDLSAVGGNFLNTPTTSLRKQEEGLPEQTAEERQRALLDQETLLSMPMNSFAGFRLSDESTLDRWLLAYRVWGDEVLGSFSMLVEQAMARPWTPEELASIPPSWVGTLIHLIELSGQPLVAEKVEFFIDQGVEDRLLVALAGRLSSVEAAVRVGRYSDQGLEAVLGFIGFEVWEPPIVGAIFALLLEEGGPMAIRLQRWLEEEGIRKRGGYVVSIFEGCPSIDREAVLAKATGNHLINICFVGGRGIPQLSSVYLQGRSEQQLREVHEKLAYRGQLGWVDGYFLWNLLTASEGSCELVCQKLESWSFQAWQEMKELFWQYCQEDNCPLSEKSMRFFLQSLYDYQPGRFRSLWLKVYRTPPAVRLRDAVRSDNRRYESQFEHYSRQVVELTQEVKALWQSASLLVQRLENEEKAPEGERVAAYRLAAVELKQRVSALVFDRRRLLANSKLGTTLFKKHFRYDKNLEGFQKWQKNRYNRSWRQLGRVIEQGRTEWDELEPLRLHIEGSIFPDVDRLEAAIRKEAGVDWSAVSLLQFLGERRIGGHCDLVLRESAKVKRALGCSIEELSVDRGFTWESTAESIRLLGTSPERQIEAILLQRLAKQGREVVQENLKFMPILRDQIEAALDFDGENCEPVLEAVIQEANFLHRYLSQGEALVDFWRSLQPYGIEELTELAERLPGFKPEMLMDVTSISLEALA